MKNEKVIMYISTNVRDYLLKEVTADIKKPHFSNSVDVLEQVIEALNSYNGEGSIMATVQAKEYINFRAMCLADILLKPVTKYITMDKETGTIIDEFATEIQAQNAILDYEIEDKKNGCYTPDFYAYEMRICNNI
jgi:hypothetical protein